MKEVDKMARELLSPLYESVLCVGIDQGGHIGGFVEGKCGDLSVGLCSMLAKMASSSNVDPLEYVDAITNGAKNLIKEEGDASAIA